MSVETETGTITLAGRDFAVSAFTFDQLQRMVPIFKDLKAGVAKDLAVSASRDLIHAALVGSNEGQISEEEFAGLRVRMPDLRPAVDVIAKVSGLADLGEAPAPAETN